VGQLEILRGNLAMVIFLYGKDTFRGRQQLKKMIEKFKKERDPAGYNTVLIDLNANKDEKNVFENILATPFLAEKRMVVVQNLLSSKNSKLQAEFLKMLSEKKVPESTVLVIFESGEDFKGKEAKKIAEVLLKEKYAQKFEQLSGAGLQEWVKSEVASRGLKMEDGARAFLSINTGADMWWVNSLLDQLGAYAPDNKISLADVKLFLPEKANDNIFELVESIVRGDLRGAFTKLQAQYDKGEDVQFVFAMLLRQIRILLELRDLFDRESATTTDVAAKKLGLHPFVVKKSWSLIRHLNLSTLKRLHADLLDLDVSLKTGAVDGKTILDIYITRVASLVGSA
jgi:DNA polymerase-3 subunit delta